jgi:hypothetical protein
MQFGVSDNGTLATIIAGSRVMKKVILDASPLMMVEGQMGPKILETSKVVGTACKQKGIELWKENFEIGNGKVDLEKLEIMVSLLYVFIYASFIVFILHNAP